MPKEISNKQVQKVHFKRNLTDLKQQAHYFFDQVWQHGYIERNEAYRVLSEWLGVEEAKAHMSRMDEATCRKVIEIAITWLNDNRRLDLDFGAKINHPYYDLRA